MFVLVGVVALSFAVPSTINYQGKLTDASGVALNGYYSMEFRIYDAPTGGTLLWTETHSSVEVTKGLFAVVLGETNPIDLPFDDQYYLEIVVNSDVLSPRLPLTTAPYAFRAQIADSVAGGSGQVLTLTYGTDDTLRLTQTIGLDFAVYIPVERDNLSDNSIDDLADVNTSGATAGQVLKWNGSAWVPANDDTGTGGGGGESQWTATATYIYPDSAGESVKIYNNGRVYADVSAGVVGGQAAVRGDVSGTVWGALGYYDGTNYRAGEFSGDVEIINSGNLYVSGQIFDGDASDPDVNIGEDLAVAGDISGSGDITIDGSATFCAGGFGFVNVNNNRIVNVADPTAAQDAATKNYVDSHFLQTVSTSVPVVGDGTSGSPITIPSGAITNAYLADNAVTTAKIADSAVTTAKISPSGGSEGQVLKIVSGTVQWADDEGGTSGVNSITAGEGLSNSGTATDPILDINAGDGLGISSDQLMVNVDGITIEIASDQLRVPIGGIGTLQLADGAVTGVKIASMGASIGQVLKWNGTTWAPADDDTGTGGSDGDTDSTNELQTLSLSGNQLTISGGNTVTFTGWDTDASDDLTTSTTFGGDVSGTYSALDINAGVVGNTEIADATQYVSVQNSAGTQQFAITDGTRSLRFAGSGYATVSFDASTHTVTVSASGDGQGITSINSQTGPAVTISGGTGISVSSGSNTVTITNSGVTSLYAGTGISLSGSTGSITVTNSAPSEWSDGGSYLYPKDQSGSTFDVYENNTSTYLLYLSKDYSTSSQQYAIYLNYNNDTGDSSSPSRAVYIWDGSNYNGSGYVYSKVRCGLNGFGFWGNNYSAGVAGFSWHDYNRSAGVLGGDDYDATWGALSYKNSGGTMYGAYWTSSASGSGLLRAVPGSGGNIRESVGFGSYGDLLGGWVRGELYGLNVKGDRYSLYIDGAAYANQPYRVLVDDGSGDRVTTYTNLSTSPTLMVSGVAELSSGEAEVKFDADFQRAVDKNVPLVITVTPMGSPAHLYVAEWNYSGFVVKSEGDEDGIKFSYVVVGKPNGGTSATPEEIVSKSFDENMDGVMFNESIKDRSATPMWWDGSKLRFDAIPTSPQEVAVRELKQQFEDNPAQYSYEEWAQRFEALGYEMPMGVEEFKMYVKSWKAAHSND